MFFFQDRILDGILTMGELTDDQLFGLLQWFVTDSFGGGSIAEAVRTQRFDSWETLQKSTHSRSAGHTSVFFLPI